jgi:hypothetical protein
MNETNVFNHVVSLVNKRESEKQAPYHILLKELIEQANDEFTDFDREKYLAILRKLVKDKKLFSGHTINNIWISYKENNI